MERTAQVRVWKVSKKFKDVRQMFSLMNHYQSQGYICIPCRDTQGYYYFKYAMIIV